MGLFKRGRTYWYEFQINGKRYRKTTGCHTRLDAMRAVQSARLQALAAEFQHESPLSCTTLREFRDQFLARIVSEHLSIKTSQTYNQSFNKLAEYKPLAEKPLSEITESDVAEFMQFLLSKQLSNATVNRYMAFLRTVLRRAKASGHVNILPSAPRKLRCDRRLPFIFSEDQYRKWLNYCPEPLKGMSILARNTGMRLGEILALQKEHVSLLSEPDEEGFAGEILVHEGKRRRLKLTCQVRDVLRSHISDSMCDRVFTLPKYPAKAVTLHTVLRQVKAVRDRGGFPIGAGLRALRMTFIAALCQLADVFTVAQVAGLSVVTIIRLSPCVKINWKVLREILTAEGDEQ